MSLVSPLTVDEHWILLGLGVSSRTTCSSSSSHSSTSSSGQQQQQQGGCSDRCMASVGTSRVLQEVLTWIHQPHTASVLPAVI
jgi:hypothetical protein